MRYPQALLAAAVALSLAACGTSASAPTEPVLEGVAPAAPSYNGGVGWGGGQYADTSRTTPSANTAATAPSTITGPGGEGQGVSHGGGQ